MIDGYTPPAPVAVVAPSVITPPPNSVLIDPGMQMPADQSDDLGGEIEIDDAEYTQFVSESRATVLDGIESNAQAAKQQLSGNVLDRVLESFRILYTEARACDDTERLDDIGTEASGQLSGALTDAAGEVPF